ncbi:MBL fold metallo-hydrolase [uncultured Aeromicrobium sp.]|uniref:MBL fold metallo-hydrolase n=1 Tax=uncultured Aeromicrobium sp. TaxID=337820 RepID=UPI0025F814FC|nr:MBL fold metallo-hydrolase [uncultured Aeromicrobium sp.]
MTARVERVVTSGQFSLDGGTWDVDNNVWLVGDDDEVLVIDAAHDAGTIVKAIGGRQVIAIVLTHGHNDHINAAVELRKRTEAPIWLSSGDHMLWAAEHPLEEPDHDLVPGTRFEVAGTVLTAIATPGHSPGSTCLYAEQLGAVFTGDTLFNGGPGATGRSYSSFETIISSIRDRLLVLPEDTVVHTGHGSDTRIGDEKPHLQEWIDRGH